VENKTVKMVVKLVKDLLSADKQNKKKYIIQKHC